MSQLEEQVTLTVRHVQNRKKRKYNKDRVFLGKVDGPQGDGNPGADQKTDTSSNTDHTEKSVNHLKLDKDLFKKLKQNKIYIMTGSNTSGKAKYICRLCDSQYHDLQKCESHLQEKRHLHKMELSDKMNVLRNNPQPSVPHIQALDSAVQSLFDQESMLELDRLSRLRICDGLQAVFCDTEEGKNFKLQLYGSSLTGFGQRDSDVNINVSGDGENNILLIKVFNILNTHGAPGCVNVRSDFYGKVPAVKFEDNLTKLQVVLVTGLQSAVLTSKLLQLYADVHPVKQLCVALRHWAKICSLDQQEQGTLPAYVFDLMVVHFLQQTSPPVLGVLPLPKVQCEEKGTVPMKMEDRVDFSSLKQTLESWNRENGCSVGELWLQLLQFYCFQFDAKFKVVSVRSLGPVTRKQKKWQTKKMAVEDPFSTKQNVAITLGNSRMYEYYRSCLLKAYEYFGLPRDKEGKAKLPRDTGKEVVPEKENQLQDDENSHCESSMDGQVERGNSDSSAIVEDAGLEEKEEGGGNDKEENDCSEDTDLTSKETASSDMAESSNDENNTYLYTFSGGVLTPSQTPLVVCGSCHQPGHIKAKCPESKPPSLNLHTPTADHMALVDGIISQVICDASPNAEELAAREAVFSSVEKCVQEIYPDAQLELFGSSGNGFVFHSSDLDISMTLVGKSEKNVDKTKIIKDLAQKLGEYEKFGGVLPIPSCKVPIIKFRDLETDTEGDISLYNTLALYNTRLLRCYCDIDHRVRKLGYAVKVFAKVCDIGDASRGSLSSYANILLMLHYLQQCSPPVIPVLQELYEGEKPQRIVAEWNAWFFEDLERLPEVWPDYKKNTQSVGQLWLGFLRYYAEQFDWRGTVVTIRRRALLTKFEKLWSNKSICVEDPFDLNHNLAHGLSKTMNDFIFSTFVKSCQLLWTSVENNLREFQRFSRPVDYFFDCHLLTGGKSPKIPGCPVCRKVGHRVRDCPVRNIRKQREHFVQRQSSTGHKDQQQSSTGHKDQQQSSPEHEDQQQCSAVHKVERQSSTGHKDQQESTTDHKVQRQSSTDHKVQRQSSADHKAQRQSSTDHKAQRQSSTDHKGHRQSSTDHKAQRQSSADHKAQRQSSTDHKVQRQSSADHKGHRQSSTDHKAQRQSSADYKAQRQSSADHKGHRQSSTDHKGHRQSSADHKAQRQSSADHKVHRQSSTDHKVHRQSCTDHKVHRQSSADHKAQRQSSADHKAQRQSSTEHKVHRQSSTEHKVQRQSSTDHKVQRQSSTEHKVQRQSSTGHKYQLQCSTVYLVEPRCNTRHMLQLQSNIEHKYQHQYSTEHLGQQQSSSEHCPSLQQSSTEHPDQSSTEHPGQSSTEHHPGQSSAEHQSQSSTEHPGQSSTEHHPGQSSTEHHPGQSSTEHQSQSSTEHPGQSSTEHHPGLQQFGTEHKGLETGVGVTQLQGRDKEETTTLSLQDKDVKKYCSLANTKEKTPMCLINELAVFNKVNYQYTLVDEQGLAHKKTFTVKLKLGDEEYFAQGESNRKAQHAAAAKALQDTGFSHPVPKHLVPKPKHFFKKKRLTSSPVQDI